MVSAEDGAPESWGFDWPTETAAGQRGDLAWGPETLEWANAGTRYCPRCEVNWVGADPKCWMCERLVTGAPAAKAAAWTRYNEAAVAEMLIRVLPKLAEKVTAPLGRIEKIVVINSGGDASARVSRVTADVAAILGQLPAVVESLTGGKLERPRAGAGTARRSGLRRLSPRSRRRFERFLFGAIPDFGDVPLIVEPEVAHVTVLVFPTGSPLHFRAFDASDPAISAGDNEDFTDQDSRP